VAVVVRSRCRDQSQAIPATPGASVRQVLEDRIVTTGLFGRSLDVANAQAIGLLAQAIGLLPSLEPERVKSYDNLALAGREIVLTSPEGARAVETVRGSARLLCLGQCAEFEDLVVQSLFLGPMGVGL
jgi:uncharacterized 2Fe-2S/4Fe-4S cluster protein (DUF4445 family)